MLQNLSIQLQMLSKQSVQYVAQYSVTHAKLLVMATASAKHVLNTSKPRKLLVRHVGKIASTPFLTKALYAPKPTSRLLLTQWKGM